MKNLYYKLSDNADLGDMHFDNLDALKSWIETDTAGVSPSDIEEFEYTINFVFLTEEEYNKICDET